MPSTNDLRNSTATWDTAADVIALGLAGTFQARLTLTTGVPFTTSNVSAASTIYLTPYRGNRITLFDGTYWVDFALTEISLALSGLLSGYAYDVFCYSNAGTPTLELSSAWANDTTRTDAITTQDGIAVKSGATTRRHVGTIRTTATTTTEDSASRRFLWNRYNQVQKKLLVAETTDSWTYNSTTIRQANGATGNKAEVICGEAGNLDELTLSVTYGTEGLLAYVGIGISTTTAFSGDCMGTCSAAAAVNQAHAHLKNHAALGYLYYSWNEACSIAAAKTFYGDAGTPSLLQSGLHGIHWC